MDVVFIIGKFDVIPLRVIERFAHGCARLCRVVRIRWTGVVLQLYALGPAKGRRERATKGCCGERLARCRRAVRRGLITVASRRALGFARVRPEFAPKVPESLAEAVLGAGFSTAGCFHCFPFTGGKQGVQLQTEMFSRRLPSIARRAFSTPSIAPARTTPSAKAVALKGERRRGPLLGP